MAKTKNKEVVIDVLKKGGGKEKMVHIEVGGARLGSIHLGDEGAAGDPKRVILNLDPQFFRSGYNVTEVNIGGEKHQVESGSSLVIILKKTDSRREQERD